MRTTLKNRFAAFCRLWLAALSAITVCLLCMPDAAAAGTYANITTPQSIGNGQSFTVTVSFTADENIGSVKAKLDYDSDVIEFVSGEFANGAGGLCLINGWAETQGKTQSFELTFKAVGRGTSQLVLENTSVYSEDGDLLGAPVSIASVTVGTHEVTTSVSVTTTEPEITTPEPPVESSVTETTTEPEESTPVSDDEWQQPSQGDDQDPEESEEYPGVIDDEDEPSHDGQSSSETDKEDMKGEITAILIIVGAVVIVCIAMSGGGSGKKSSGRKRRSGSSRSRKR